MASVKVDYLQCDFCPNRAPAESDEGKRFERLGGSDICPLCFRPAYDQISSAIGEAWFSLKVTGNGPRNGKVIELLKQMYCCAIHVCVGSEKTE